ncbi:hypothetical protein BH11MYX2_BH11MYX2_21890 [soil metagenome]
MLFSMEAVVLALLAFGGAGGIAWVISAANKRTLARRNEYATTAQRLGLTFSRGPQFDRYIHAKRFRDEMYGTYDGHDVYVGVRTYTTSSGKSSQTHYYTYIDLFYETPLKRGLSCATAAGISKFFGSIFGQADMQLGHDKIDYDYKISGLDKQLIAPILTAPEVEQILVTPRGRFALYIGDAMIRIECPGDVIDVETLQPRVAEIVALARALVAAWRAGPPSAEERAIEPVWRPLCEQKRLALDARGMRATGEKNDLAMRVEVELDEKKGFETVVETSFDPPLAVSLELQTEGTFSGIKKLFGGQDIEVGHAQFDKTFVVKGKDPQLVKQMLNTDACTHILEVLGRATALRIDDNHVQLRLTGVVADGAQLSSLMEGVARIAGAMVSHRRVTPEGPYR